MWRCDTRSDIWERTNLQVIPCHPMLSDVIPCHPVSSHVSFKIQFIQCDSRWTSFFRRKLHLRNFNLEHFQAESHDLKPVTSTLGSRSIFERSKQMGQDVAPSNLAISLFSLEFSPLKVCAHNNHVTKFLTWVLPWSRPNCLDLEWLSILHIDI